MTRSSSWLRAAGFRWALAGLSLLAATNAQADPGFEPGAQAGASRGSTAGASPRSKTPLEVLGAAVIQRSVQTLERMAAEGTTSGGLKELPLHELFSRAQQAYQAREWASAQALLLLALERDPLWAAAWLRLGNALQQVSDTTSAMRAYRRCVDVSHAGDRSHGHKALANIASLQLERFDEALAELERWGAPAPSIAPALMQAGDAAKQRLMLAREQSEPVVAATAQDRVPVYQGWSARRQPGKRQLALPPEDRPIDKPAPSKPVLRASTGVRPALPKVQTQEELQGATPEVIYLKGGEVNVGGVKPAETRPK